MTFMKMIWVVSDVFVKPDPTGEMFRETGPWITA